MEDTLIGFELAKLTKKSVRIITSKCFWFGSKYHEDGEEVNFEKESDIFEIKKSDDLTLGWKHE